MDTYQSILKPVMNYAPCLNIERRAAIHTLSLFSLRLKHVAFMPQSFLK